MFAPRTRGSGIVRRLQEMPARQEFHAGTGKWGIVTPRPTSAPDELGPRRAGSIFARRWCERRDLNSHGFPHWILNPARLPVPPLSHEDCGVDPDDFARNTDRAASGENLRSEGEIDVGVER